MFRSKSPKSGKTVDQPDTEPQADLRPESDDEAIASASGIQLEPRVLRQDSGPDYTYERLSPVQRSSSNEQINAAVAEMRETLGGSEPIGQAFGHVLKELARLKVRGDSQSQALETGPICRMLKEHLRVSREQTATQHDLADRLAKLEQNSQKSEEENHFERIYKNPLFATQVAPPDSFGSPEKRPLSFDEMAKLEKLLPRGHQKFTGGRSGPPIVEFLDRLNDVQRLAKLSEEEFRLALLNSCTGEAYTEVKAMLEAGVTTPKLYYVLEKTYDKSDSPLQALQKLGGYKASKDQTSKQVENYIHKLAILASRAYPKGTSRAFQTDVLCIKTYIDALPARAADFVRERINDLTVKLDRSPTFSEVSTVLDPHRFFLDTQLANYGKGLARKANKPEDTFKAFHGPTYRVNAAYERQPPARTNARGAGRGGGPARPPRRNLTNPPPRARVNYINTQPRQSTRPMRGSNEKRGGHQKPPEKRSCTLCGRQTHTAAMGCFQMRDDNNKVVKDVTPTWGCCTRSEKCKALMLRHPEIYCPERQEIKRFKAPATKSGQ